MSQWPAHDWKDSGFAAQWEAIAHDGNPLRREQLDLLIALLGAEHPGVVLDLGVGSGLVAELVLEALPDARLIGLDSSPAMLALAHERLARFPGRVALVEADLGSVKVADCLDRPVDVVISVQTLHNLEPSAHRRALAVTGEALAPGTLLIDADRCSVPPALFDAFRAVWSRVGADEGATPAEHAEKLLVQGDQPVSLATELRWLDESGFDAACLHCVGNRAVIVGRRR
ncbi:MAG TPA: class I SAM-dependent methyltransferase [Solirubrobacteraceae bacterium]|nr:class I SAM-dependent methyltransferase [Solirubrobacteraceae bacterium]